MFFISCLKLAKCLIAFHTLHVAGCYCTLFLSLSLSVCHCITIFSLCLPQYIINHEYQLKATAAVVNSCKSQFSIFFTSPHVNNFAVLSRADYYHQLYTTIIIINRSSLRSLFLLAFIDVFLCCYLNRTHIATLSILNAF